MKREILFVMLCIGLLSICATSYAGLTQPNTTSMLSDQEMTQIIGSYCPTCYLSGGSVYCRWMGSLECTSADECGDDYDRESDIFLDYVTTEGTPNGLVPTYRWVPCYTRTNVIDNGDSSNSICTTAPQYPFYDDEWYSYWYHCKYHLWEVCRRCSWGIPIQSSTMEKQWYCTTQ